MLFNMKELRHYIAVFLCSIVLLVSAVPILCFLIVILIYRGCVWTLLKRQYGDAFGGLLQHHDALWGVEEDKSLSVVQSLILCQSDVEDRTSHDLLKVLEEKVRVWMTQPRLSKMFKKRKVKYGYNYLVDIPLDDIQVEDYVKLAEVSSKDEYLTDKELKKWISDLHNVRMPDDHSNFLEIIVSKKAFRAMDNSGSVLFPVLIRIHHSLGDGVVIVKLLTTDEAQLKLPAPKPTLTPVLLMLNHALEGFLRLPLAIVKQQTTPPDSNSIHSDDKSSTRNFVNWYFEEDVKKDRSNGDAVELLHKIKTIKAVESGITFQDVLCASLSVTLYKHFAAAAQSTSLAATEEITIGNAVQLGGDTRRLTNNCAYNFERIPVTAPPAAKGDLVAALREIRRRRAEVSKLQQANYLIIRFCSVLPDRYLRRLLSKNRCSMGVSNIPGPSNIVLGHSNFSMKHLSFWTPNRFKTRLGLSVFTLQNRMHLGLGGDRCSFGTESDSGEILRGIVEEIHRMYEIVILNEEKPGK